MHPEPPPSAPLAAPFPWKAFRHFNGTPPLLDPHSRSRGVRDLELLFPGDSLECRLARALLAARALPWKELLESFEVFQRVRKRVRRPVVADLCAGHGLTGLLFAVYERGVEEVVMVDRREPESAARLLALVGAVAPWAPAKVRYVEADLRRAPEVAALPAGSGVVGVHACGPATDAVVDVALTLRGPVGLLPCCHARSSSGAPDSLVRSLGVCTATDVHRTYRLEAAGYRTRWTGIPAAVTPMNRVILAWPERPRSGS